MAGDEKGDSGNGQQLALLRLLRLIRVLRIFKMGRLLERLLEKIHIRRAFFQIIKFVCIVLFVVHIIACFFYLVPFLFVSPGSLSKSWIHEERSGLTNRSHEFDKYIRSTYWALTTVREGQTPYSR